MKITRNNKLDLKQTIIVNTKQLLHDKGPDIVAAIDNFFVNH